MGISRSLYAFGVQPLSGLWRLAGLGERPVLGVIGTQGTVHAP
jgi:hypothetical protein